MDIGRERVGRRHRVAELEQGAGFHCRIGEGDELRGRPQDPLRLGALALVDIGQHFPPGDPQWKNADSRGLLRRCNELIGEAGWLVGNADITVICEAPKVGPHAMAMRELIASDLGVTRDEISVKATTSEKLGFTGRGEGIAAMAVCLLVKR